MFVVVTIEMNRRKSVKSIRRVNFTPTTSRYSFNDTELKASKEPFHNESEEIQRRRFRSKTKKNLLTKCARKINIIVRIGLIFSSSIHDATPEM